jgi:hypothetical protein
VEQDRAAGQRPMGQAGRQRQEAASQRRRSPRPRTADGQAGGRPAGRGACCGGGCAAPPARACCWTEYLDFALYWANLRYGAGHTWP